LKRCRARARPNPARDGNHIHRKPLHYTYLQSKTDNWTTSKHICGQIFPGFLRRAGENRKKAKKERENKRRREETERSYKPHTQS